MWCNGLTVLVKNIISRTDTHLAELEFLRVSRELLTEKFESASLGCSGQFETDLL